MTTCDAPREKRARSGPLRSIPGAAKSAGRFFALAPWFVAVAIFGSAACRDARFPVCKEDTDCIESKGKRCVDLRCVECRGDDDCGDGRYCERKLAVCRNLSPASPAQPSAESPSDGATPETVP